MLIFLTGRTIIFLDSILLEPFSNAGIAAKYPPVQLHLVKSLIASDFCAQKRMSLEEQMFGMVSDWKSSGEVKSQFLKGTGVSPSKFDYWLRKFNESAFEKDSTDVSPDFISIDELLNDTQTHGSLIVELTTRSGVHIKVFE